MGTRSALLLALFLAIVCGIGISQTSLAASQANASEMAAFFHDDLAPYGRWVDHRIYGTVWVPDSLRPDWHPYSDGRWVWTSDYGWYWDSREPYGWATYHYGTWVLTSDYGWVWVPGSEWGPAWVDWYYGGGYVGWAPMPPAERRHEASRSSGATIDVRAWIFVAEPDFVSADVGAHRAPAARNGDLLRASARVTNYASVNGRIVNRSIDVARIAAAANTKIEPVHVVSTNSVAARAAAGARGTIAIYRPLALAKSQLTPGSSPALDLDLPAGKTPAELDHDAVAKAQKKLDDEQLPDEPSVGGSFETSVGGTLGSDSLRRAPSAGTSGSLGAAVPGIGGIGIGR